MDSNIISLIPPIAIVYNICLAILPGILLSIFGDFNIPKDMVEFKKLYENKIDRIEQHKLGDVSNNFENAVGTSTNQNNTAEEDDNYLMQLGHYKTLFSTLNEYNLKQLEHVQVLKNYECVKHYQDNFYKFWMFTLFLAVCTTIIIILNSWLIYLLVIVLFPFIEALRCLYKSKSTQKHIKKCVNSIEEDYKQATFLTFE
ncbi:MAG: hypothetical protein NKF70_11110 [Methanobacterium sp. ERen5]|nr:MAG: hypothetical protein NKF70_11110 [Methanobacterium sp. ERen5]